MTSTPIYLPALGEGVREVRVLAWLKQSGEAINRDEPVAEVETDKAAFLLESPATGVVDAWQVQPGESYPVGTLMTTILAPGSLSAQGGPLREAAQAPPRRRFSPRVLAWCRSHGIDPTEMPSIPASHPEGRLSVEDLQRWVAEGRSVGPEPLLRGDSSRLPTATLEVHIDWDALRAAAARNDAGTAELFAWCVARAMTRHPKFRSTRSPRLGIAVALRADGLAVGAVDEVPLGHATEFRVAFRRAVSAARTKQGSPLGCSVVLSDMSSFGVRSATPVVVPPAVATCFLGEPFDVPTPGESGIVWRREAKLVMAFDHRIVNGVGAACFLKDVRRHVGAL